MMSNSKLKSLVNSYFSLSANMYDDENALVGKETR